MRLWPRFKAACDYREPAIGLSVFRILVGLVVLHSLFSVVSSDLVQLAWIDVDHGGYRPLRSSNWLLRLLGGATPTVMWSLITVSSVSAVGLVIGLGGRITALICLQTFMACTDVNSHAGGSYDELMHNALWLLVLGPPTATLSVDCRIRTGVWHDPTPRPAVVRFLVIYQLLLMYWTTGLQKLSAYWVPGGDFSALYYILQQPSWHRVDMEWIAPLFPLTQLGTAVTWFWEVGAPLWGLAIWFELTRGRGGTVRSWFNRLRVSWIFAALGISFHLAVTVMMNIGPFSWASLAYYVCLIHPVGWERLTGLLDRGQTTSPQPAGG